MSILTSLLVLIFLAALVAFPISLAKPNLFSKFYNSTRKKNGLILGSIIIATFILIGITTPPNQPTNSINSVETSVAPTNSGNVDPVDNSSITITLAPTATSTPTPTVKPTLVPSSTPVPTKKVIYNTPTQIPTTSAQFNYSAPTNLPAVQDSEYGCNCSKTCTQISSCSEAQYQLTTCGCSARDGDGDGIACDSAPLHCQN